MANPREGEKELALWSIDKVREVGGILEHPKGSKLFPKYLPDNDQFPDEFDGFTVLIDQYDFGHVAHKETKLYFCGLSKASCQSCQQKIKAFIIAIKAS